MKTKRPARKKPSKKAKTINVRISFALALVALDLPTVAVAEKRPQFPGGEIRGNAVGFEVDEVGV